MNSRFGKQRGVALVITMLVTAMAAIAAVSMVSSQQMDIHRTSNMVAMDQAYTYAQGIEEWARIILLRDQRDGNKDHLNEFWASSLPPLPVDGGYVIGAIRDLNGCFNLNNIVSGKKPVALIVQRLQRLFSYLGVDPQLTDALIDWIDVDIEVRFPTGAEDDYYLSLDRPYRSANRALVSISELRLVKGFSRKVMNKISRYVCVLPVDKTNINSNININTANPMVLRSLFEGVTEGDVEALLEARTEEGFESVEAFLQNDALAGREGLSPEGLSLASDYFMITAEAYIGDGVTRMYSLVQRREGQDKPPVVWRRSLGVKD
ncbi:MAG: type II secretion system minor pseudopilin GspK [Gammaproteobacteria bacterium]|nr:type II secretion system minor pseudopilin GspK [Gammaproteobacteria bacterium]